MLRWLKRDLPCETGLVRATKYLENACKTKNTSKDRPKTLQYCDKAQESLERIKISIVSPSDLDRIIAKYYELAATLAKLEFPVKAHNIHTKANELSVAAGRAPLAPLPLSPAVGPTRPSLSPAMNSALVSSLTLSLVRSLDITSSTGGTISQDKGICFASIFTKDCAPPLIPCKLPDQDERLVNTQQLVICLALLQVSSLPESDTLTSKASTWLTDIEENPDEKERLKSLATDLIRAYDRDELKKANVTAEVVCLAPVLDMEDYRLLLSRLVDAIEGTLLLDLQALDGLAQLLQGASPGHLRADDLVKILQLLSTRLKETHKQSPENIYPLTMTVSRILDAMVDIEVKGLDRVNLHEPLKSYLDALKSNKDPYMVFHAAYAYQALLFVPDNEKAWQAAWRRAWGVLKGIGGLVSAVKGLNVNEFIEGLSHIQGGFEGAGQVYKLSQDAYKQVTALLESGQSLQDALKKGLSFDQKRDWYPLLRSLDVLLRNGELTTFKDLIFKAPCRRDPAFLWGICQRLGRLAADSLWDIDARKGAIAFLGMVYQDDTEWGQDPHIKQCILDILLRLRSDSDVDVYASSYLLDQVQNKPSVEPELRKLRHRRLKDHQQLNAVYIPPQAKANRDASDDDLFDLTIRVNKFLSSDQKVLLLLGDSGAGKSTFNLELESDLWKAYHKGKGRIPLFITLPAIDNPEHDLIKKHLQNCNFKDAQIEELKTYHEFILICDGYDECQKTDNLYKSNHLNQSGEWKVKMVISCRSEYLGSDYRVLFQPGDRNNLSDGALLLQEAVIAPFSNDRIRDYIRQYVQRNESTNESTWNPDDYWRTIESIPTLQELVKNPFLLTLTVKVLPLFVDLTQISRLTLYDHFVEEWARRGQMRLIECELGPKEQETFDELKHDGFSQHAICFVKDLAVAIFEHQDGNPVVTYSTVHDKKTWKAEFFDPKNEKSLLRAASPLTRRGNQYQFIHRSVLEYGLARAAFEPLLDRIEEPGNQDIEQEPASP
ncbi:hypothetical protein BGZ83_000822, partial [Gryganskiella cystojenkinii]